MAIPLRRRLLDIETGETVTECSDIDGLFVDRVFPVAPVDERYKLVSCHPTGPLSAAIDGTGPDWLGIVVVEPVHVPGRPVDEHCDPSARHECALSVSAGMVALARRAHPHLRFGAGALEALPMADATLGGLLAWYSLIHTAPDGLPACVRELARVLRPGAWLLTAFQPGDGRSVERTSASGHPVTLTNYRHDPQHLIAVLTEAGFDVHTQLHRSAEGTESTPRAVLLARRRS